MEITLSAAELKSMVEGAWSPKNFFKVWAYTGGIVGFEQSKPLGQYYMRSELA